MSADSYILLDRDIFLEDIWAEILRLFECESRGMNEWGIREWVAPTSDGPVWLGVREIRKTHSKYELYKWEVGIHFSGWKTRMLWIAFAIPYHCLILFESAVYETPSGEETISKLTEFESFAKQTILRKSGLGKLAKYGFLDDVEDIVFDTDAGDCLG